MCYCVVLTAYSIACSSINLNRSSMSVSDLVLESAFRKLIKFAVSQLSGISSVYFSFDINPIISSSSFVLSQSNTRGVIRKCQSSLKKLAVNDNPEDLEKSEVTTRPLWYEKRLIFYSLKRVPPNNFVKYFTVKPATSLLSFPFKCSNQFLKKNYFLVIEIL